MIKFILCDILSIHDYVLKNVIRTSHAGDNSVKLQVCVRCGKTIYSDSVHR